MTGRLLGMLGGMSWESTAIYYGGINRLVQQQRGGLHSAALLLHSFDFAPIASLQAGGRWQEAASCLARAAAGLADAGAGAFLICSNTMHKLAEEVAGRAGIPLLHICDPLVAALQAAGISRVGLLATRFTMEESFYRERLAAAGISVVLPDEAQRECVHRVIFEELCCGRVLGESKAAFAMIADNLAVQGAQGVILGCTEIAMLLSPEDTALPLFDTTSLHIGMAAQWLTAD